MYSQDGTLDTSFNVVSIQNDPSNNWVYSSVIYDNGDALLAGRFKINGVYYGLAKVNSSGALIASFNPIQIDQINNTAGFVYQIQRLPNNQIIVSGFFDNYLGQTHFNNGNPINGLIRINPDGTIDNSFMPDLTSFEIQTAASKFLVDNSNNVYIFLKYYNNTEFPVGNFLHGRVVKFNSAGVMDDIYFSNSLELHSAGSQIWDMEFQSNGKIVLVGQILHIWGDFSLGEYDQGIIRINQNGTYDNTFNIGNNGIKVNPLVYNPGDNGGQIEVYNDDSIFFSGEFTVYNGASANGYVKLNPDGTKNTSYISTSNFSNFYSNPVHEPKLLSNEKVILPLYNSTNKTSKLVRLNSDGSIDSCFDSSLILSNYSPPSGNTNEAICDINIFNDGSILVGGHFNKLGVGFTYKYNVLKLKNTISDLVANDDYFEVNYSSTTSSTTSNTVLVSNPAPNSTAMPDTNNGSPITSLTGYVLTQVGVVSPSPANGSISLNSNGTISVAPNTPYGTYQLQYNICTTGSCPICSNTATIYVKIKANLVANDDSFISTCIDGAEGGYISVSVLSNDTINGVTTIDPNSVSINLLSDGGINGLLIDSDGIIFVPENSPSGDYVITYNFYMNNDPSNLSNLGTISICVLNGFNPSEGANNYVFDIARQSDGKIIIVGAFTLYNGVQRNRIARLNSDFSLDTSFDSNGIGFNDVVYSVAITNNDKIIVGGRFTSTGDGNVVTNKLARVLSNGNFDSTFTNNLFSINGNTGLCNVVDLKIQPSTNNIIVGGNFDYVNSDSTKRKIAFFDTNGVLQNNFVSLHTSYSGIVNDILILPNSDIIVGGGSLQINDIQGSVSLYKLNSDGTFNTNFIVGKTLVNENNSGIVFAIGEHNGDLFVGGKFDVYNSNSFNNILKLNSIGEIDYNFDTASGADGQINTIETNADDILVGGKFNNFGYYTRPKIARIFYNGDVNPDFDPYAGPTIGGNVEHSSVIKAITQPNNYTIIGGYFDTYNDQPAGYVTRVTDYNAGELGKINDKDLVNFEDGDSNANIMVYPNPSQGFFNLVSKKSFAKNASIEIYNYMGQVIFNDNISDVINYNLDLNKFSSGTYFLKIVNGFEIFTRTLIKY